MVETQDLVVTPRASEKLQGGGTLGIRLSPNVARVTSVRADSKGELVRLTNGEFARIYGDVYGGITTFLGSKLSPFANKGASGGGGGGGGAELSGPIGVVQMGAEIAGRDAPVLLNFAAAISINLAVINALPLPALDGGQLVFVLVEVLRRGRKLDVRTQETITSIAVLALALLSVGATVGDVWSSFLSGK